MSSGVNCASCGAAVTAATSFMTEHGFVCWPCQTRLQNQQEAVAREINDYQRSLSRRAAINGRTHGFMWGVTVILTTRWMHFPGWVGGVLFIGAVALMFGLAMRSPWAFRCAVAIDLAGALALVLLGVVMADPGATAFVTALAIFPLALSALAFALRAAYLPAAGDGEEIRLR